MYKIIIAVILLASPAFCETYSWEDSNGIHFTDDISKVPSKNQKKYLNASTTKQNNVGRLFNDVPWYEEVYNKDLLKCEDPSRSNVFCSGGYDCQRKKELAIEACKSDINKNLASNIIRAKTSESQFNAENKKLRDDINSLKLSNKQKERLNAGDVWIGLPSFAVKEAKGSPKKINKTETAYGDSEQWIYGSGEYLYFTNGILKTIQKPR